MNREPDTSVRNASERAAREVRLLSEMPDGAPRAGGLIQVIPFGRHQTEGGSFELDEAGMAAIMSDFEHRANDMVIDYEHQTLGGGEAPAAGWIKRLISKGREGLWAVVEWTPRAVDYLKNREYRYLSPVFLKSESDGRVARLINAALTNQPAIDGMVPLVNKANDQRKEVKMKKLFELLGLPQDATEERAEEAVESLRGSVPAAVNEALGLAEGTAASEAVGAIEAIKLGQELASELAAKAASLEQAMKEKEASELVAAAMKEGRITPVQADWARAYAGRDPEGFKAFVAKAPVVVRLGEVAPGGEGHAPAAFGLQGYVNRALGITDEAFRKHNSRD